MLISFSRFKRPVATKPTWHFLANGAQRTDGQLYVTKGRCANLFSLFFGVVLRTGFSLCRCHHPGASCPTARATHSFQHRVGASNYRSTSGNSLLLGRGGRCMCGGDAYVGSASSAAYSPTARARLGYLASCVCLLGYLGACGRWLAPLSLGGCRL